MSNEKSTSEILSEGSQIAKIISSDTETEADGLFSGLAAYCYMLSTQYIHLDTAVIKIIGKTFSASAIGANGLSVNNKMYPYKSEFQQIIHNEILKDIAVESKIPEIMISKLLQLHENWCRHYKNKRRNYHMVELIKQYNEKAVQLENEAKKPFRYNSRTKFQAEYIMIAYPQLSIELRENMWNELLKHKKDVYIIRAKHVTMCKREITAVEYTEEQENTLKEQKQSIEMIHANNCQIEIEAKDKEFEGSIKEKYGIEFSLENFERETNKHYESAFKSYVLRYMTMTNEEYEIYKRFEVMYRKIETKLVSYIKNHVVAKSPHENYEENTTKRLLSKLRVAIKKECKERYSLGFKGAEQSETESEAVGNAKLLLDEYCKHTCSADNTLWEGIISNCVQLCKRYYGDVLVKYREARILWGKMSQPVSAKLRDDIEALKYERNQIEDDWVNSRSQEELEEIHQKLASCILGNEYTTGKMLMIPTGILATANGNTQVIGLNPFDDKLETCMESQQWSHWKAAWAEVYRENSHVFNQSVYKAINNIISAVLSADIESLSESEQKIYLLCDKYNKKRPEFISISTGKVIYPIDSQAVYSIDNVLEKLGKYIERISFEAYTKSLTPEEYRKGLKAYLSGQSSTYSSIFTKEDDGITLNAYNVACVGADNSITTIDLGAMIYKKLSSVALKEFDELIGNRANMPKVEFFRMYGRRVDSYVERRELTLLTIFISEFNHYILGELKGELSDFFDRISIIK